MQTIHYIYTIVNNINGKYYVGYTVNPPRRWSHHLYHAKKGKATPLYDDMRLFGVDNFSFDVIYCSIEYMHTLSAMEHHFIAQFDSKTNGYNSTNGGQGSTGRVPKESTILLWSSQRKNRKNSEEHKANLSRRMKENPPMNNPETRKKVSETHKARGIRPIVTREMIEKKRQKAIGRPIHSEEHKLALSKRLKENPLLSNEESKAKQKRNKLGKGAGVRNGNARFCEIYNSDNTLIASGHLKTLCISLGYPFNTFLENSRYDRPMLRGNWIGWNVVKIPKPPNPRMVKESM